MQPVHVQEDNGYEYPPLSIVSEEVVAPSSMSDTRAEADSVAYYVGAAASTWKPQH
ncbi:MAG: hypothetical protein R2795_20680 [Saprospiraceae bacterium]